MDPDAAGRIAPDVARLRLLAHPRSCPEVVVVACRHGDVDRVGDLAVAVRPERRAVEGLAGLPRQPAGVVRGPHELLDLDDDVVPGAETRTANGHGDRVTGLRGQGDARLGPIAPGPDARVDAEEEACDHQPEARIDRDPLLGRALAE